MHHRTTLLSYILKTKACIDNWKKPVKQQYLLHMCSQYGELRSTNDWEWFISLGHPNKIQRFRILASLLHRHHSMDVKQTLHMFGHPLNWYTIYTFLRALAPKRNSARCNIQFASKSCVLFWQDYCMALEQWVWAKLCGMVSSRDRAAIPFDIGQSNCLVWTSFLTVMIDCVGV